MEEGTLQRIGRPTRRQDEKESQDVHGGGQRFPRMAAGTALVDDCRLRRPACLLCKGKTSRKPGLWTGPVPGLSFSKGQRNTSA